MDVDSLTSASLSDRGRVRKENQDAILVWQEQGLFILADGMGGAEGGEHASHTVVDTVQRLWRERPPASDFASRLKALCQAVQDASRTVKTWADDHQYHGCGTTLVALLLDLSGPRQACVLHAGDSRTYRLRDDSLQLLTRDHSMAAVIKKLRPASDTTPFENVITRAVGLQETVELEETRLECRPGDLFLLCSDGLSRMVPDLAITEVLRQHREASLDETARALVSAANAAGGRDNISVILVRVPAEGDGGTERRTDTQDTLDGQKADQALNPPSTDDSEVLSVATPRTSARADGTTGVPAANPREATSARGSGIPGWVWGLALVAGILVTVAIVRIVVRGRSDTRRPASRPVSSVRVPEAGGVPQTVPSAAARPVVIQSIDEARRLAEQALSSGRWGALFDRCTFSDDVREAMGREGLLAMMNDWHREWTERRDGLEAVPSAYEELLAQVRDLTTEMGTVSPGARVAVWPGGAAERADLYCRELRWHQTHVLSVIEAFIGRTRADLDTLGSDPSRLFGRLETLIGPKAFGTAAAAPVMQDVAANLGRLERWVASVRGRSFRAGDARTVVQHIVPVMGRDLDALWAGLWNDIKAMPDRPGAKDDGAGRSDANWERIVAARTAIMQGRSPEWDTAAWRRRADSRAIQEFAAAVCTGEAP